MADVRMSALSVLDLVKQRELDKAATTNPTTASDAYGFVDDRLGDEKDWRGYRERGYERSTSSMSRRR